MIQEITTADSTATAIPRDLAGNLRMRADLVQRAQRDTVVQAHLLELFRRDACAFFNMVLWTYDPRKTPADRPFVLWPFQEAAVRQLDGTMHLGESLLVEKTRDMGATWMILGTFYYRFLVHNENFLAGSKKEELVDKIGDIKTHFERLRYFIKTMEKGWGWLFRACGYDPKNSGYMKIWKKGGASITGESMNPEFSRQGRYNAILLDEFAFIDQDEAVWRACGDSAPCKLVVSTPNGSLNKFSRLRKSGQIPVLTLHWKLHPEKTEAWYVKACERRSEQDIAQELDINYTVSAGKPFYGEFKRTLHVRKLVTLPDAELILGWDYGYHHPCCVMGQCESTGRFNVLDVVFGEDQVIDEFGRMVQEHINRYFRGLSIRCYGDPAGEQHGDKSERTSVEILKGIGFTVHSVPSNTPDTNYHARKQIIEGKLRTMINGIPSLVINDIPRCQILVEAFEGGYRYPDEAKYGAIGDKPVKDDFYDHAANCLEYIMTNMFKPVAKDRKLDRKRRNLVADIFRKRKNGGLVFGRKING